MGGIAAFLSAVLVEALGFKLKEWAFKVALAASMLSAYTACYLAFMAAIAGLVAIIYARPSIPTGLLNFLFQFFPSGNAIAIACTAFFGSMAIKKACAYWVKASKTMALIVK